MYVLSSKKPKKEEKHMQSKSIACVAMLDVATVNTYISNYIYIKSTHQSFSIPLLSMGFCIYGTLSTISWWFWLTLYHAW